MNDREKGKLASPKTPDDLQFAAKAIRKWLNRLEVTTLFVEPGSPWENGYVESFVGKLRDELLNGEVLDTLDEANVLVEAWRKAYNRLRPHSSLGDLTPRQSVDKYKSSLRSQKTPFFAGSVFG